jgi:hypothetical protein
MGILFFVILLSGINLLALAALAYTHFRVTQLQQKTLLTLAVFKKAGDPFEARALQEMLLGESLKDEPVIPPPFSEETLPQNADPSFLTNLRNSI